MTDINQQIADINKRTVAAQRMAEEAFLKMGGLGEALSVLYLATRILEDAKFIRETEGKD
ncbi:TPA: hypothetical protein ACIBE2_004807 [Salmonella enterica subsp. diarizonae serovar 61:r:-]